jgi:hypothetical protein
VTWSLIYTKQAQKDASKLAASGFKAKPARIAKNDFISLPIESIRKARTNRITKPPRNCGVLISRCLFSIDCDFQGCGYFGPGSGDRGSTEMERLSHCG